MLERHAFSFYKVVLRGEELRTKALLLGFVRDKHYDNQAGLQAFLDDFKVESEALGLTQTYSLASHVETRIADAIQPYTYGDALNDLDNLLFSFGDALRQEGFFRIPRGKEQYLGSDSLFGPEVGEAFPSSYDDIRNAGTCFAIELYDGCVFHLMQILQIGMNALAQKFDVPFLFENWEQVINNIEKAVKGIDRNTGPDWREQKTAFSAAASQFYFLKDAIRNHFIHGRERYDEGRALSVLAHVREFMQSLAAGGLTEPS